MLMDCDNSFLKKVKQSRNRPGVAQRVPEEAPIFS